MANIHEIANFLWSIAGEVLRDDFKRSKYPDIILPFTVLRRLDCVLVPTKDKVLEKDLWLKERGIEKENRDGQLCRASDYAFYNTSKFDFPKLLDDPKNIAKNFRAYINGFSENIRDIINNFQLRNNVDILDQKGLLFMLIQKFAHPKVNFHPDEVSNLEMGTIFEELIRRFNEQTNENPGEHFTPREVIELMVHLVLNGDRDILNRKAVLRSVYDPACGSGGMLSAAKEYVTERINPKADIRLFGQEVNPETYAISKSDMLIKGDDEDAENIKLGSTLSNDGHARKTFDYQLSNPPYGKDWKKDRPAVRRESENPNGRFHVGTPRISDGQMLFLLHMISKMTPVSEGGGRMAVVSNGSPLFTGDAGSGESEIRRHVLENDLLETIVALPSQLFYNTGIHTYIWVLSNRKPKERTGKVLLVNGAATAEENGEEEEVFAQKMRKSLGDKRNELSEEHVQQLADLAAGFEEGPHAKIFDTEDFGYRKVTIERPLRLSFKASPERIELLKYETAFQNLAKSRKKGERAEREIEEGEQKQEAILAALGELDPDKVYKDRDEFDADLDAALERAELKIKKSVRNCIHRALSERDETAEICINSKGNPEPDTDLRDYEKVPLAEDIYEYFDREVRPHVPDAWIDEDTRDEKDDEVGKVGYEINFNRYFYVYEPPRPLEEIEADLKQLENEIAEMLSEMTE